MAKNNKASKKTERGFVDGLMYNFGYVKKDIVLSLSSYLENKFAKDKDGNPVVSEDIENKFKGIRDNIKELLTGGVIVKFGYVNKKDVSSLFDDVNIKINQQDSGSPKAMNDIVFDSKSLKEQLSTLKRNINSLINRLIEEEKKKKNNNASSGETGNKKSSKEEIKGEPNCNSTSETDNAGKASDDESPNADNAAKDGTGQGGNASSGETGNEESSKEERKGEPNCNSASETDNAGDTSGDDSSNADNAHKGEIGEGGNESLGETKTADGAKKKNDSNGKKEQSLNSGVEELCQKLEKLIGINAENQSIENRIAQIELSIEELKNRPTMLDLQNQKDQLSADLQKYEFFKTDIDRQLLGQETSLDPELYIKVIENFKKKIENLQYQCNKFETDYNNQKQQYDSLWSNYQRLQSDYDQCQAKVQEFQRSDVGELKETINEKESEISNLTSEKVIVEAQLESLKNEKASVDLQLKQTKMNLDNANETISNKNKEIKEKNIEIKLNKKTIEEKENEIDSLTKQSKQDCAKIEEQEKEIVAKQNTINEKETQIRQLKTDNSSLNNQVDSLTTKVDNLEKDKKELTKAKELEKKKTQEKVDFINAERDAFAKSMMALAENLSNASGKDFLGCCDEAFESNRVSLQEKVAKPIRAFVRELAEIDPKKYVSQKALEEAYYALVKENMDSTSGLTRIAQWYAYSCIPFMVDEDRSDGLFVRQAEIRNMYSLATKLLGMVGMEYRMPILFTERMSDDKIYDDVTGKRQLNIEYMCPTARSHKENIDCIDNSSVIIDVVEVGYCDNRGNNKNPQVII